MAIAKGYKIKKIHELWDFLKKRGSRFKGDVQKFMKIKMESNELKNGECCTSKTVDEYKKVVKSKLGIVLGKIEYNPGMRAIGKLCLNTCGVSLVKETA